MNDQYIPWTHPTQPQTSTREENKQFALVYFQTVRLLYFSYHRYPTMDNYYLSPSDTEEEEDSSDGSGYLEPPPRKKKKSNSERRQRSYRSRVLAVRDADMIESLLSCNFPVQTSPFIQAFTEYDLLILTTMAGDRLVTVKDGDGRKLVRMNPGTHGVDLSCALCHQTHQCSCTVLDLLRHITGARLPRFTAIKGRVSDRDYDDEGDIRRRLFRAGFGPKKNNRSRGKHLINLVEEYEMEGASVRVDEYPENFEDGTEARKVYGTYVRPLGAAENCWTDLSMGNGIFLPKEFPHNKTVKGLKPYLRVILPAMAVSLSTFLNQPTQDPGIPFMDHHGNFSEKPRLDQKENFRRINEDLESVVEDALRERQEQKTTKRLENQVKRQVAKGCVTTGKGIIGIRTRLTNAVASMFGGAIFSGKYGRISTERLLDALGHASKHSIMYVNDRCDACSDRPNALDNPFHDFEDTTGEACQWCNSSERFDVKCAGREVCLDCLLLSLVKYSVFTDGEQKKPSSKPSSSSKSRRV